MIPGLTCPHCGTPEDTLVTDSRPHASGRTRRHKCGCGKRFTTLEVVVVDQPRRLAGLRLETAEIIKARAILNVTRTLEDIL